MEARLCADLPDVVVEKTRSAQECEETVRAGLARLAARPTGRHPGSGQDQLTPFDRLAGALPLAWPPASGAHGPVRGLVSGGQTPADFAVVRTRILTHGGEGDSERCRYLKGIAATGRRTSNPLRGKRRGLGRWRGESSSLRGGRASLSAQHPERKGHSVDAVPTLRGDSGCNRPPSGHVPPARHPPIWPEEGMAIQWRRLVHEVFVVPWRVYLA